MGIYSRSPSGARRKRRKKSVRRSKETVRKKRKRVANKKAPARARARTKKATKRVAKVARKRTAVVKKRARRVARPGKPAKKKIAARKGRAKRTRISKQAKARKPARTKKAAARTRARKPTPKKRASRKKAAPKARKRAAPKKPKKPAKRRRRKTPTKAEIAKENRRLRAELAQIKGAEGKAQPTPKKSRARRKVRSKKRGLERSRIEQALAIHEYPHATPAEALKSRKEDWKRKQKRFRELFDKAAAAGQLPMPERVRRRLDTHRSQGQQTVVRIRRRVTARTVESIVYKVDQKVRERLSGRLPLWIAKLTLTSMGEKLIGSGNRLLVIRDRDQDAEVFYTQSYDSTGAWNSLVGMLDQLRGMLEDYASYRRNVIYLHSVKVQNFERKK